MSERYTAKDVRNMFDTYCKSAANIGYYTDGWNLKITTGPLTISAARGLTGPDAFEGLPGLDLSIGTTYRDAYKALWHGARLFQAITNEQPQHTARPLYRYEVGGAYGRSHVKRMYDIKRDGSYTEMSSSDYPFEGTRKDCERIARELNHALSINPVAPAHTDPDKRYVPSQD